jgi:hypothetical protein
MPFYGEAFDYAFFLGDLRVQGDVPGDELTMHLRHGNLLFIGRLDDTHCRLIVALHGDPMDDEPAVDDFQKAIDLCGIENLRVSDPRWMTTFRVSERRTPAYSKGRVFLAGDATNIHSPVGGQGMNTGIQDAGNLIWKISLVQCGRARRSLLDSYDAERKPISDALVKTTAVALRAATSSNWLLEHVRDLLMARVASLDAVQDRLRGAVSEIGIHYRHSAIVHDAGGNSGLRAGDRAPDCEVTDETGTHFRIFDLLREPLHTVIAAQPSTGTDLPRLARLLAHYRDIMQGSVLKDGDAEFRTQYVPGGSMLYVVRPDGYIGFRGKCSDIDALEKWAQQVFAEPAAAAHP